MATTTHRIDNPDSWRHGLYCACGLATCRYSAGSEPKVMVAPNLAARHWATLPHDVRESWRRRFDFDGPWLTVADMAYEHAQAYR